MAYSQHDYDILKKTIYYEARGEPRNGQIAVANVILNRMRHPGFPNAIADVCLSAHQFECWEPWYDKTVREHGAYNAIDEWLPRVLSGDIMGKEQEAFVSKKNILKDCFYKFFIRG
ncbi:hypothetical protein AB6A40_010796 [Gnathostoma spinigerum]|uniref:Cell wall hydrolase SleB domain-containing protein n=1 Tax=Gnathostoma spinigerum TaxID=75299 RepID=A0ABD6EYC9_9BILA